MKRLIVLLVIGALVFIPTLAIAAVDDLGDYEVNESLSPYLNAVYVGRNTAGALILWSDEVPGNYMLVPKIGTQWVLTYKGYTYNFVPINDSRIRLERRR